MHTPWMHDAKYAKPRLMIPVRSSRFSPRRFPFGSDLTADGEVEDLPYEALTIYDRWLHGGAWMTLETGAIWLSHLLSGNGLAWVVDDGGLILAYAEAFVNRELTPMNTHLHLAQIMVDENSPEECASHAVRRCAQGCARSRSPYRSLIPTTMIPRPKQPTTGPISARKNPFV